MKRKLKKKEVKKGKHQNTDAANTTARDEEKQFDFGGLPERNLKKNLGC